MTEPVPSSTTATLTRLNRAADCLDRYMQAVTAVVETDARLVAEVAKVLPKAEAPAPGSHGETMAVSHGFDSVDGMVALVLPRLIAAGPALERAARALRRTEALIARLQAGWPQRWGPATEERRAGPEPAKPSRPRADDGTGGDTRERLFDDLREEPDDSGLFTGVTSRRDVAAVVETVIEEAEAAVSVALPERGEPKPPAPQLETVKRHMFERAAWIEAAVDATGPPG
jgi:hypothetical protein